MTDKKTKPEATAPEPTPTAKPEFKVVHINREPKRMTVETVGRWVALKKPPPKNAS